MKNNRLNTTSIREIKSSFRRFLSLLIMSALGVGVFVGLRMSSPDMLKSLDTYYDNSKMYDIKVLSTLGLTNEDVNAIKKLSYIKNVYASYSKDVILKNKNHEAVTKVIGITPNINVIDLKQGRLPKSNFEVVVEEALLKHEGLNINDSIEILDEETFKNTKLTIVGTIKSPLYIGSITAAPNRGNTNLGSGKINYYIYVNNDNFKLDYYTEIYVNVKGSIKEETNSKDYNKLVSKAKKEINAIKSERQKARYDQVYDIYKEEIEKNKQDGNQKLVDAVRKLNTAKKDLESGRKKLAQTKSQLDIYKNELDVTKIQFYNAKKQIDDANKLIESHGLSLDDINKLRLYLKNNNISEDEILNTLEEIKPYYDEFISYVPDSTKINFINYITSDEFKNIINDDGRINIIRNYINDDDFINNVRNNINNLTTLNEILNNTTLSGEEKDFIKEIIQNNDVFNNVKDFINDDTKLDSVKDFINDNELIKKVKDVITINITKENVDKLASLNIYDIRNLLKSLDDLNSAIKKYNEGYITYNNYYNEYQNGLSLYNNGLIEYNKNLNLYNEGIKQYYDSKSMFDLKIKEAEEKLTQIPEVKWYVETRIDLNEYANFIDDGKSVSNLAKVFPSIFFIVAILVSLISMSRMVEDDRGEIGVLKSLGFSNRHIRRKYLIYSGVATVLGSIIGGSLGYFLLPYFIFNIYKILFAVPIFKYKADLSSFILGTVVALICICGTTLLTIKKVLKEKPSDLMRPKAPKNGKRVILEKIPFIWKHINFSNKVTIRNLFRYKKRVLMTVFGILGCTSLMLVGFGIRDSIVDIPKKQYEEIFHFDDIAYITGNPSNDEIEEIFNSKHITKKLLTNMIVSSETGEFGTNIFVPENENDIINALELRSKETKEKITLKDDKVVISDKLAELKNIKVGDKISVNDNNGIKHEFVISDICENYVGHYVFMNKKTYEKEIAEYETNIVYYNLDNIKYENDISKKLLEDKHVMSIISVETTMNTVDDMLKSLNSVVLILIFLSGALSFVVLYNLSYINITERKREIATLKVLGFTDKEVDNYIIKETVILTILGIIFGLLIGILLTYKIIDTVEVEMVRFLRNIDLMSFILTSLFIMLFTLIVSIIIHFYLRKIDMIESLKSVE